MNITAEKNGDYALKVNLKFDSSDYQNDVKKELNKIRRTTNVPGFRTGNAPMRMIENMYGKSVLVEKVNELISKQLEQYIKDENLNVIASPIPSEDSVPMDFDTATSFDFTFDIALAPEVSLDFIPQSNIIKYHINCNPDDIEKDLKELQRQFMRLEPTDETALDDYITLTFETPELGLKSIYLVIGKEPTPEAISKQLIGLKKEATVAIDVMAACENDAEAAARFLTIKTDEEKEHLNGTFTFTVQSIQRPVLAELNEELFSKAFPGKEVKTLEEAKKQINDRHSALYQELSDVNLYNNLINYFLENVTLKFSDEFLRRYINLERSENNEKALTDEEYQEYRKSYCQDFLLQKFVKEFDITINYDDVKNSCKKKISRYFGDINIDGNDYVNGIIENLMKDKKQVQEFYVEAMARKIIEALKNQYSFKEEEISYKDFLEKVAPQSAEMDEDDVEKAEIVEAQPTEHQPVAESKGGQLEMQLD